MQRQRGTLTGSLEGHLCWGANRVSVIRLFTNGSFMHKAYRKIMNFLGDNLVYLPLIFNLCVTLFVRVFYWQYNAATAGNSHEAPVWII
jgi:hypothetical protein